ncbi:MAG: metallophosphoesterase [Bacteroidales bacterium]|nr:metallophosphoesterase [Bacteroidales bacterium]
MFIVLLLVLLGSITYTSWRFWLILPMPPVWKSILTGLYVLCFLTVFLHFARGNKMPLWVSTVTYEIGTSWMIFFLYALLLFLAMDLGRILHLIPASFLKDSAAGTFTVAGVIAALLAYGYFHYHHKYREVLEIHTEKPLEKPMTIVLASDIHAGYHNRKAELGRWVDLINAERPDLVLFAGDLLDGAIRPAEEWDYASVFRRIQAPVYASLGNHEYITGIDASLAFFADAGIRLLRDAAVTEQGVRIVGRDDRSNPERRPVAELAPPDSLFTILLDHQPYHLEEAEQAGIDFQFSGHTHHGQVWPGNWVTDAMYEKAFGPHQRGNTRYYVSSGLGIWGGKFRIGTRSEYIVLKLL